METKMIRERKKVFCSFYVKFFIMVESVEIDTKKSPLCSNTHRYHNTAVIPCFRRCPGNACHLNH